METSKSARWSATRWSTPSYRPQRRIRCSSPASRRARRWVNSSPWGERRIVFPGPNRSRIDSTPAKIGSGFITIPPPPPNGGSSVTRCLPAAKSRRSCTSTVRNPASLALERMLLSSGPETIPGKSVRISTRIQPPLRGGHDDAASRNVHFPDKFRNDRQERLPSSGTADFQPVVGGAGNDACHAADGDAVRGDHRAPDEVDDEVLIFSRRRKFLPADEDAGPDQLPRSFQGFDPLQRKNGTAPRPLCRVHLESASSRTAQIRLPA